MVQYEIKITGRVQGVGYRYFILQRASEIGLKGWVENSRDGGVEIVVQGKVSDIQTFINYLKIGPPLSMVKKYRNIKSGF